MNALLSMDGYLQKRIFSSFMHFLAEWNLVLLCVMHGNLYIIYKAVQNNSNTFTIYAQ